MDPLTLIALAGVATTAVGSFMSYQGAQAATAAQIQEINIQENIQRQQEVQMALVANRLKLQEVRAGQQTAAAAKSAAVNQGAGSGSGLAGGEAQIFGQEQTSLTGLQQNFEIGKNIYGLNFQLDQAQIQMAQAQSSMMTGQGLTSLGGAVTGNLGAFSNITSGLTAGLGTPGPAAGSYSGVGGWSSPYLGSRIG